MWYLTQLVVSVGIGCLFVAMGTDNPILPYAAGLGAAWLVTQLAGWLVPKWGPREGRRRGLFK